MPDQDVPDPLHGHHDRLPQVAWRLEYLLHVDAHQGLLTLTLAALVDLRHQELLAPLLVPDLRQTDEIALQPAEFFLILQRVLLQHPSELRDPSQTVEPLVQTPVVDPSPLYRQAVAAILLQLSTDLPPDAIHQTHLLVLPPHLDLPECAQNLLSRPASVYLQPLACMETCTLTLLLQ